MRILLMLLCCVPLLGAADGAWTEDFAAAQAKAKAEGKDLLIDFTGSDWCHWCVKLKEEVFDHDVFSQEATKHFVLVELDFPNKTPQDEKIKQQNQALQKKYNISGYPTILLIDHNGEVYGRTGYQAGGPEKYLEHLATIRAEKTERENAIAAANKLSGMEKVEKLGEILKSLMKNDIKAGQADIIAEIKKLDPQDSKGFINAYEFPNKMEAIEAGINENQDFDKALKELDAVLATTANKEQQQQIYMFKAMIYMRGKQDQEQTLAHYKKAADVDPESELAKQIYKALKAQGYGEEEKDAEKTEE